MMTNALLLALTAASAAAGPALVITTELRPSQMSKAEIRDHNAKLDRKDPQYIRCVKSADTGSLVARRPVCRTNAQWAPIEAAGRDAARAIADEAVSRSASSSN